LVTENKHKGIIMSAATQTEILAAAASGATTAVIAGRPPEEVLIWALLGAIVAVWINSKNTDEITVRWVISTIAMLCVSVICGVAGSAIILSIANQYEWLRPFAAVPRWAIAFVVAAGIHVAAPPAWLFLQGLFKSRYGGV
jgi:hypothetical protein